MRMWGCAKRRISDVKSDDNENADVRPYLVRFYNLIFFWKCKWGGDSPMGKLTKLYLPRHDFMQRNGLFPPLGPTCSEFHISFKA